MHQNFISLALLIATTLVAGFFAYIYSIKRQTLFAPLDCGLDSFRTSLSGTGISPRYAVERARKTRWIIGCNTLSGLLFFLGAQIYSQRKPWKIPALILAVFLGLWAASQCRQGVRPF